MTHIASLEVDSTTTTKSTTSTPIRPRWVHSIMAIMVMAAFSCRFITIETKFLQAQDQSNGQSKHEFVDDGLRFCRQPMIHQNNVTLRLLYQCQGPAYENFAHKLHALAKNYSQSVSTNASNHLESTDLQWGHRPFPLPSNKTVLVLGNSHLRQISKTILCQYSDLIDSIHPSSNGDIFAVAFRNGAIWMSITNTVLVYSHDWLRLLEAEYIQPFLQRSFFSLDAIIFGKFTSFVDAQHTNFETTMNNDQMDYNVAHTNGSTIDFATIPPPRLVDLFQQATAARISTTIDMPILSVPMFSQSDQFRAQQERQEVEALLRRLPFKLTNTTTTNRVHFLNTRQFIDQMGLECGSDDKYTIGTCHEPDHTMALATPSTVSSRNQDNNDVPIVLPRSPADMHRCAGLLGGHADLVAWSVIEALYKDIFLSHKPNSS